MFNKFTSDSEANNLELKRNLEKHNRNALNLEDSYFFPADECIGVFNFNKVFNIHNILT